MYNVFRRSERLGWPATKLTSENSTFDEVDAERKMHLGFAAPRNGCNISFYSNLFVLYTLQYFLTHIHAYLLNICVLTNLSLHIHIYSLVKALFAVCCPVIWF